MAVSQVFRIGMLCIIGGVGNGLFFSWSLGTALLASSIALACAFVWQFQYRSLVGVYGMLFLLIFLGSWLRASQSLLQWELLPDILVRLDQAIVVDRVKQTENAKQVVLRPLSCENNACPSVLVLGFFPSFADITEGDVLALSCVLERPATFSEGFDYPKVLAKDGIGYVCRFPKKWAKEGKSESLFASGVRRTREVVERVLRNEIPEPESGLVLGLLVGGDGRLPEAVQNEFSRTGLSHIVAVSGYNVSIIAVIVMSALIFLGLYRQQALWGVLLGIIFFVSIVGAPASAVRAAIMVSVALFATHIGRVGSPINGILCAAAVMVLINPLLLRYDIGFQLSFAATIGIFLLAPFALLSLHVGDILATTLAAELFVLPIILFHFHSFPILSLLVNLCVLPLVPLAMMLGAIALCCSVIFPWFGEIFGIPAFLVSRTILEIVHFFSVQRFALVSVSSFGIGAMLLWYGVVVLLLMFLRRRFPQVMSFQK
ncbi:MAG: ComEC/Rec2 family competence protein [Candidatus Moraniibacteriota bacterium]|nr:MAG: ComEC/Rec2 family competence protein [Candidatus Moranbacteria bacterium]